MVISLLQRKWNGWWGVNHIFLRKAGVNNDCSYTSTTPYLLGPRWHSGYGAVLQIGRSLVRSHLGSLEFFIDIKFFRWPWGWLSLKQKWVPGVFLGGKGGWCVRLTNHHPVPLSWNLGILTSWNLLGNCRPVTGLIYLYDYKVLACRTLHVSAIIRCV